MLIEQVSRLDTTNGIPLMTLYGACRDYVANHDVSEDDENEPVFVYTPEATMAQPYMRRAFGFLFSEDPPLLEKPGEAVAWFFERFYRHCSFRDKVTVFINQARNEVSLFELSFVSVCDSWATFVNLAISESHMTLRFREACAEAQGSVAITRTANGATETWADGDVQTIRLTLGEDYRLDGVLGLL